MSHIFLKASWVMVFVGGSLAGQTTPSVQSFFRQLARQPADSSLPTYDDVLKVVDEIPAATPDDITVALPVIVQALSHPNDGIKVDAAFALTAVAMRADSASLLEPHLAAINSLFDSANDRLQNSAVFIFSVLKPKPPQEIVPPLLNFLAKSDRDTHAQASAVGVLARYEPEDALVTTAIKNFLSRKLDPESRASAFNALRSTRVKPQIVDMIIAGLDDPNQGVRFTAVQVIPSLGRTALLQAQPALEKMANRPGETQDVKKYANEALAQIKGQ